MKRVIAGFCLVLLLLGAVAGSVTAGEAQAASGQYCFATPAEGPYEIRFADGNLFERVRTEDAWTGTILGFGTSDARIFIKDFVMGPPPSSGPWNGTIVSQLEGVTVEGHTGDLSLRIKLTTPNGWEYQGGTWLITGGTDELSGLHGSGTWAGGGVGPFGTELCTQYEGSIHFEP
jgi:hypothetical protein